MLNNAPSKFLTNTNSNKKKSSCICKCCILGRGSTSAAVCVTRKLKVCELESLVLLVEWWL